MYLVTEPKLFVADSWDLTWFLLITSLTLRSNLNLYDSLEALLGDARDGNVVASGRAVGLRVLIVVYHTFNIRNTYLLGSTVTVSTTEQVVQCCWDLLSLVCGMCG